MAVVDDTVETRRVIETMLRRDGYTVYTADDGAVGLELVLRERPDVVISDVMMPKVSGFELCRILKADRAMRLTPVVLVTGNTER
ncbi:MAG: response regulator, partial [Gammaproteobacteria bacterium]